MPSLFAGTENFVPAFQGRQLAIESGRGAGASISRGMNTAEARKRGELAREESEFSRGMSSEQTGRLPALKSWLDSQIRDDEPMPFTGETSASTGLDLPPPRDWARSGSGETLNVAKAQKIINAFTADPSWLADPRTAHAANAIFGAASKVVGMNVQLEKVNSQLEGAQARNSISRDVGRSLLKMSELGGNASRTAAKWNKLGDNGRPLWEDSSNWEAIMEDASKYENPAGKASSLTMQDGTVLQGFTDRFGNFHQSQMQTIGAQQQATASNIDKRFENQKELAGVKFQNQKDLMKDKAFWSALGTEEKTILGRYDKAYSSALREVENFQKAGVLDSDNRMISARARVADLAIKQQKFLDLVRPEPEGAAGITNATTTAAPSTEKVRVRGPNGQTGKAFSGQTLPEGWSFE